MKTEEEKTVGSAKLKKLTLKNLMFENTGGTERDIIIDLPASTAILDIQEFIFVFFGLGDIDRVAADNNLLITDFSIL